MIKFRDTHFADGAVLWTGRFGNVTGFAFVVLFVEDLVVVLFEGLHVWWSVLFGDLTWWYGAGLVIDPETDKS